MAKKLTSFVQNNGLSIILNMAHEGCPVRRETARLNAGPRDSFRTMFSPVAVSSRGYRR